jgi:hypothetical protein
VRYTKKQLPCMSQSSNASTAQNSSSSSSSSSVRLPAPETTGLSQRQLICKGGVQCPHEASAPTQQGDTICFCVQSAGKLQLRSSACSRFNVPLDTTCMEGLGTPSRMSHDKHAEVVKLSARLAETLLHDQRILAIAHCSAPVIPTNPLFSGSMAYNIAQASQPVGQQSGHQQLSSCCDNHER